MSEDTQLTMLSRSGDYELLVRQQPKEALVTQAGKEKSEFNHRNLVMSSYSRRTRYRQETYRPTSHCRA